MINSATEARENLRTHRGPKVAFECLCERCFKTEGYLAALEGPEVKILLSFARDVIDSEGYKSVEKAEYALAQYRKAVNP